MTTETETKITITVDDLQVETEPGKMVLEAALQAGIYVPYLCYHPGMKPFAACRMCMVQEEVEVEVERDGVKVKEIQLRPATASCTLPVREGMVIKTTTGAVRQIQEGVMEMIISEHPHGCLTCHRVDLCGPEDICQRHVSVNDRCVVCAKNERCELKDSVRFLGMELNSPLSYKTRGLEVDTGDPFYDRDYDLCIVCGRCVRVCEEVRGDNAITFIDKAGQALVGTSQGTSLLESGCEFCGACLDVCPVGALVERDHKWDKAERVERTVCPNCSVGCLVNLEVNKRERVIRVVPEINAPANQGQACFKGKFGLEFVNHKDRLRHPLIRKDGELQRATWEEAMSYIAQELPRYKGKQFAAIASARSTNEAAYLLQKFTRVVMESNSIDVDSNTRPALTRALIESLGYAASTNPTWELEQAGCILVVDANVTEEHNVLGVPIKKAVARGAQLVVIDSREVELTRYARLWLRPRPGTTLTLLGGLLRTIMDRNLGLADEAFIGRQYEGLEAMQASLEQFTPELVSDVAGVPDEQVKEAARFYATSGSGAIVYALDNVALGEQSAHVKALADMALVTDNLGKRSTGLYALRHGANEQGAADVGCAPDMLPGYKATTDDAARTRLSELWGAPLPEIDGMGMSAALEGAWQGTVKAMLLLGDGASLSSGEQGDSYEALGKLEFLIVHDAFLGEAAQRANVVLPAATFAEEDGTYTNLERRVQLLSRVISPTNTEAEQAWRMLCHIARQMDAQGFEFESAERVFDEAASVSDIYGGISHQRLRREAVLTLRPDPLYPQPTQMLYSDRVSQGIQWPCRDEEDAGIAVLYTDGFPGGSAKLMPVDSPLPLPEQPAGFPLMLTPGRVLLQEDRGTIVFNDNGMNRIRRDEQVELHPESAAALGVSDGDAVSVVSETERWAGMVRVTDQVLPGVVSMTTLFGELAVALQASEETDPMLRVPRLVVKPVRLERAAD